MSSKAHAKNVKRETDEREGSTKTKREIAEIHQGYKTDDGNTTPSPRTSNICVRLGRGASGGKQVKTSVQRISTCGDGSDPKNTVTGSAFEKFSP